MSSADRFVIGLVEGKQIIVYLEGDCAFNEVDVEEYVRCFRRKYPQNKYKVFRLVEEVV